ncbi:MAG: preprotein translocase subunit YajC [Planctomycetota bacterium]|jgi:preprotein translocase subunit YajC
MTKLTKLFVIVAALAVLTPVAVIAQEAADTPAQPEPLVGDAPAGDAPEGPEAPPAEGDADEGGEQPTDETDDTGSKGLGQWFLPLMLGAFVLMYLFMGRNRRKQESKRREMLAALKKGDKVTSIGGVCGTVIEVKDDEVVVKVDETNNIRMRFARWAIRGVGDTAKAEKPADEKR